MSDSVESTPKCPRSKIPRMSRLSNSPFAVPPTPFLEKIGYGTGVSVYHLDRVNNGSPYSPWALKKVNKRFANGDFAQRIKKEAGLLKSFNHPNIVGFRGFTKTEDGREVLAMEECSVSLGDMIEERMGEDIGPFESEEILSVAKSVAKALHYLHSEKHLIHGDIKSHNILVKGNLEDIKLCDFGVSIETDSNGEGKLEDYVGTSCWSAPETLADGPLTNKSDIFSFGLVLWEMIALTPPHIPQLDESDADVSLNLNEEQYGTRPELPDLFEYGNEYDKVIDLFKWCTESDYKKRPTALEIIKKIEAD